VSRPAVPTEIKIARGNPGKRALPKNEAKPKPLAASDLEPPRGISPRGRKFWNEIAVNLYECGLLTVADHKTLLMYVEAYAEWAEATTMVRQLGAVVGKDKFGNLVKFNKKANLEKIPFINPWCRVANAAFNRAAKLIPQLGLSPSSRAGIPKFQPTVPPAGGSGSPDGDDPDDFSDF